IASLTGFVKRRRKLIGSKFVQTLVFGWLANPQSTLNELSQTAATVGVDITPQALEQRFTPEASETLKQVLDASIQEVISSNPQAIPLLQRFNKEVADKRRRTIIGLTQTPF
ncbi:MAG: IS4/IS5 family transposase, partial [Candidatus Poribacteria bacterium]